MYDEILSSFALTLWNFVWSNSRHIEHHNLFMVYYLLYLAKFTPNSYIILILPNIYFTNICTKKNNENCKLSRNTFRAGSGSKRINKPQRRVLCVHSKTRLNTDLTNSTFSNSNNELWIHFDWCYLKVKLINTPSIFH